MKISTTYMGIKLASPLVVGASPLGDDTERARELVDAGAAAVVMHSLFQEQLDADQFSSLYLREMYADNQGPQLGFMDPSALTTSPEEYLARIQRIKRAVGVPVIGSLNGSRPGGWIRYAEHIEQAGADALELNLYAFPSDPTVSAMDVERQMLDIIRMVTESVRIPVAVKLSPFLSSLPHFAAAAQNAGAAGLVLFNRFYDPAGDGAAHASKTSEPHGENPHLQLRLYWLAVLAMHLKTSLAISGGVNSGEDMFKAVKAGARVCQVVSAMMYRGPGAAREMLADFRNRMEEHRCDSIEDLRSRSRFEQMPDPEACERIRYMHALQRPTL